MVEADEYDRSFLHLRPEIALITNVEPDHLEYYGSVEAMHEAFYQFLDRVRSGGILVRNLADPFLRALPPDRDRIIVECLVLSQEAWFATGLRLRSQGRDERLRPGVSVPAVQTMPAEYAPVEQRAKSGTVGSDQPASDRAGGENVAESQTALDLERAWRASDIIQDAEGSRFTLHCPDGEQRPVSLTLSGIHNVGNALQAIAAAAQAGVPPQTAAEALRLFRGAGRRFQPVGEVGGVLVIDNYAHHPTEVRADLAASALGIPIAGWSPSSSLIPIAGSHTSSSSSLRPSTTPTS